MIQSPPQSELRAGSILGRYELLLPIAKGGMAQVWAARLRGSRGFQKWVAIKTILPDVIDNTRMERMFLEEAQLASQIHHPNVVGTLELGEHEGTLYLVMDWVDGEPLNRVLAKAGEAGGLPLAIAVNLIGQACKGLYAAHELRDENGELMGLVHRDVSPQNLLVSFSGTAKLVDFGIAKATARSSGLTEAGEVKGKFAFMAPEQVRGQVVDCRTDLFALGILLYSITTGRHPFRGAHPGETLQNICSERPPTPPREIVPDYPEALEAVVMKALSKAPEQRFATGYEMFAALDEAMPEALEARFELRVAEYLTGLFGAHASARRAAIRLAQEQADRQRADASLSSVGTLRAISIDSQGSGSFSVGPASTALEAPPSDATGAPLPPKRSRRSLAIAGLGVSVVCAVLLFQLAGASAPDRASASASPVPPETPTRPARPTVAASLPPAPAPSSATPEATPEALDKRERKTGKAQRSATLPVHAQPAPSAAAAHPTTTPPTIAASARPAPPPSSANAWDRGAFGGRH
jgi:eukaryotic-like serine/threonine-protein kinase